MIFFFVPVLLFSIFTPLFLPSLSVSLSYFIHAVAPHSPFLLTSPFSVAILNGTSFFLRVQLKVHNVYSEQKTRNSCVLVNLCL